MRKKKRKSKAALIRNRSILIIVMTLALGLISGVFAKYIHTNNGKNVLAAKEFYFTSDLLKTENCRYVLNSTATGIEFTLGNNADKLRFSEDDINYTVTVTADKEGVSADVILNNSVLTSSLSGILVVGEKPTETKITLSNLQKGVTYTVTAVGEAGYKQTLQAEFYVSDNEENVYWHVDTTNPAYVLLTVWTENATGTLSVKYEGSGLIPDNTNPVLTNVNNYGTGYGNISFTDAENFDQTYSSYTYRFFIDGSDYSGTFTIDLVNATHQYIEEEVTTLQ